MVSERQLSGPGDAVDPGMFIKHTRLFAAAIVDMDGRILAMNDRFSILTGCSTAAASKRLFQTLLINEDKAMWDHALATAQVEGYCNALPIRLVDSNGRITPVLVSLETLAENPACFRIALMDNSAQHTELQSYQEREQRYLAILNGANDGLWDADLATGKTYWNDRFYDIIGLTRKEMTPTRETVFERIHPEDRPRVEQALQAHFVQKAPYDIVFRIRHRSGQYRTIHSRGKAVRNEDGQPVRMSGAVTDITNEAIRESNLARLFNTSLIGITFSDYHGNILDANEAFLRMVGYTRQEMLQGDIQWRHLTPPEYLERDEQAALELAQHGYCTPFEKQNIRKDGTRVDILIGKTLLEGTDDQYVCFIVDISEQKRMQLQLQSATERFQNLYEWERRCRYVTQSIREMDDDRVYSRFVTEMGRILDVDRCLIIQYEDQVKFPIQFEYRKNAEDPSYIGVVPEGECPFLKQYDYKQAVFIVDTLEYRGSVSDYWIDFFIAQKIRGFIGVPIRYGRQDLCTVMIHCDNPRIWSEHEVAFVSNVSDQLAITLYQNKVRKELEKTSRLKSHFLSTMSHELRNPLNSVIGYSDMMLKAMGGPLNVKQTTYVNNINGSAKHLLNIINDILDISKIEAGKVDLIYEDLEWRPFLHELVGFIRERADRKGIGIVIDVAPQTHFIRADGTRLKQILINLLSNAVKFNREQGRVYIRVAHTDDREWVILQVEDTGIGIDEKDLPNLFTEFYQVDNSYSRHQEGTGLGLNLTRKLVELHGGTITVASTVGKGTRFEIRLPAAGLLQSESEMA